MTVMLLSFFVSVTVEAPFLNLEKLFFSPLTAKKSHAAMKIPVSKQCDSTQSGFVDTHDNSKEALDLVKAD